MIAERQQKVHIIAFPIFGDIVIDVTDADAFLNEIGSRAAEGEKFDPDLVLNEARNLITATIHPAKAVDPVAVAPGSYIPHNDKQDSRTA